jgi:hypothetical protein
MKWSIIVASAVVAFWAVVFYPFFHNRFVHPLGRLSSTVHEGQACADVREAFSRYAREHASPHLQFGTPVYDHDLLRTRHVPPTEGAFLYDVSLFDDIQLTVRCSPDDRVAEVLFIGD